MTRSRTLSPTPSIAEIESARLALAKAAASNKPDTGGDLYRQAHDIAYPVLRAGGSNIPSGEGDPTLAAVQNGYKAAADDEPDHLSSDRSALRSAVDDLASALMAYGRFEARLLRIIRVHERSGKAANPEVGSDPSQSYTGHQAEAASSERDHVPLHEELTDRRHWDRKRR